jgi:hypothetical protein
MSTKWKVLVCVSLALAVAGVGIGLAAFLRLDVEVAQDADAPVYIDLNKVMLKYNDPMRNMDGMITYRQVFQDALWWQIMDPHVSEDIRAECFGMAGILSEGRGTEITQAQYDILMNAVQQVWGPAVVVILEEELQ